MLQKISWIRALRKQGSSAKHNNVRGPLLDRPAWRIGAGDKGDPLLSIQGINNDPTPGYVVQLASVYRRPNRL
jgi:hypothetical protein